mgnify:CR=1 FL=1
MLTSNIQNPDSALLTQFPNELLYKGPALIICNRAHQDYQNLQAFELMRNNCLSRDKNRYPRSIDIESELYRINFYRDKCFYDNYKLDPRTMPTSNELYQNRSALVHDYSYYQNHQDTAWNSPRPLSTTPGGSSKPSADHFQDIAWNLTAQREATTNYADAPNFATMNQCDSYHAYTRSSDCGASGASSASGANTAACGIGLPDEEIIRGGLLAQTGPYVPGIRAHKVEQGGWKSADTRMKQLEDGVLRQQLDTDWAKFNVVAKDGKCIQQLQHFPSVPAAFPLESNRPGVYYNKPEGENDSGSSKIVRQVFPISGDAQFYNFQRDCPKFQPERLFYNISKNRMVPNSLNYVNFRSERKGENLKP